MRLLLASIALDPLICSFLLIFIQDGEHNIQILVHVELYRMKRLTILELWYDSLICLSVAAPMSEFDK